MFARLLRGGSIALGESYVDGWWDSERLDQLLDRILSAHLDERVRGWEALKLALLGLVTNRGTVSRALEVGRRHYDLGNGLFEAMLDRRMVCSCAYWERSATLDEAQEAKLDLVCATRSSGLWRKRSSKMLASNDRRAMRGRLSSPSRRAALEDGRRSRDVTRRRGGRSSRRSARRRGQ